MLARTQTRTRILLIGLILLFVSHVAMTVVEIVSGTPWSGALLLSVVLDTAAVFLSLWMIQAVGTLAEALERTRRAETTYARILREKSDYKRQAREGNQRADLVLAEKKDLEDEVEKLHLAREVLRLKSDLRDGMTKTLCNQADQIARHIGSRELTIFLLDDEPAGIPIPQAQVKAGRLAGV